MNRCAGEVFQLSVLRASERTLTRKGEEEDVVEKGFKWSYSGTPIESLRSNQQNIVGKRRHPKRIRSSALFFPTRIQGQILLRVDRRIGVVVLFPICKNHTLAQTILSDVARIT